MKWLGGLAVAVLIVVGLVTMTGRGPTMPGLGLSPPPAAEDATPGYAAEDARLVRTDDDGRPLYQLQARRLDQAPETQDITASDLTLDYTVRGDNAPRGAPAARPWKLTARRGNLPDGSRRIQLNGDVRLVGQPQGSTAPLRVETQSLDFDMERQIATTKLPTNFYWGTRRLSTRGLTADLKRGTLRLESSVHGRFLP
jgi:LPS export ABC transporter protein LptC